MAFLSWQTVWLQLEYHCTKGIFTRRTAYVKMFAVFETIAAVKEGITS